MIFKTFDSNINKWTAKIGMLGMSFHNLGTAISTSFQTAKNATENPDNSTGFFKTFKDSLLSSTGTNEDYTRNQAGEIVTRENIDTHIPSLNQETIRNKLSDIEDLKNGSITPKDYYKTLDSGEKYLSDLVKNTDDLSKLTGEDLVAANERARAAVLSQNEALKQQSVAAKASKAVMQAVSFAGNMIAGALITKGIELAVTAIDNLIHREERLAEAAKTASENIKNSYSSFNESKQSTVSITQEFAELSQHVNQATGENIDLPAEEYQRFLELSNQLAETFPNIGYTIDESGNKITGLSGNVDEITQSINNLIQAQQLLSHQDISNNMEDSYKKAHKDVTDYKNQIDELESQKTQIKNFPKSVQKLLNGEKIKFQKIDPIDDEIFREMSRLFENEGLSLKHVDGQIFLNMNAEEAELNATEKKRILSGADQLETDYSDYNKDKEQQITDLKNKIQMSKNSFSSDLLPWLTTDQNYTDIVQSYGSDLGTAIQKTVQSLDLDPKNWDSMEALITDNILAPLYNADNNGLRNAYIEFFTNTDLPLDSAMAYLSQIEEYYHDHNIEIPTIFTEQKDTLTGLQKKFKDRNASFQTGNTAGLEKFFQENSIDEADEYEKWLSITEGITDATEAMAAWKQKTEPTEKAPLSFQESWDSLGTTGSDEMKQSSLEAKEQLLELAETGNKLNQKTPWYIPCSI